MSVAGWSFFWLLGTQPSALPVASQASRSARLATLEIRNHEPRHRAATAATAPPQIRPLVIGWTTPALRDSASNRTSTMVSLETGAHFTTHAPRRDSIHRCGAQSLDSPKLRGKPD